MELLEKVVKGLEVHIKPNSRCVGCPYPNNGLCGDQLYSDALSLIRQQQEAVKPVKQIEEREWTVCGNCREHLISKWMFCPYCGKAVKWDAAD